MKKIFISAILLAMSFSMFTLTSCSNSDNDEVVSSFTGTELKGEYSSNITLEAGKTYTLSGPCIIKDGGVLTIPAGTTIKAANGFGNYILVSRGGKINVNGTASAPVRMISVDGENAGRGKWGGLIINGKAPISGAKDSGNEGSTEIAPEYKYGGTDSHDNSGSITYLELRSTGSQSDDNVEHNGLTLDAVGDGTKIENIYVIDGADDAIEFFGGSVNVKNLLAVNLDDDLFDFTQGYTGTLENAYGVWPENFTSGEDDPRGIEIDGNLDGKGPDDKNQSNFKIKNVTIVNNAKSQKMYDVIKVRRGAKVNITNALVKGSSTMVENLINFTDSKGAGDKESIISLTSTLPSVTGAEILGEGKASIVAGNTGADTSVFGWTKYKF